MGRWCWVEAVLLAAAGCRNDGASCPYSQEWIEVTTLHADDGYADQFLGVSVAIAGDTVLVGANVQPDDSMGTDPGSAYVFVRQDQVWTQQAKLVPSDGQPFDRFGTGVALEQDTAVIIGGDAAYVYQRVGENWAQEAILPTGSGTSSVALAGDTAVIGDRWADPNGISSGQAYVFVRIGTEWMMQATLVPSDSTAEQYCGESVAIDSDSILVGCVGDDTVARDAGAAYVFTRSGTAWSQQAKLLVSGVPENQWVGLHVAISGDSALLGAFAPNAAGAGYLFLRAGSLWSFALQLPEPAPTAPAGCFRSGGEGVVGISGGTSLLDANVLAGIDSSISVVGALQPSVAGQISSAAIDGTASVLGMPMDASDLRGAATVFELKE